MAWAFRAHALFLKLLHVLFIPFSIFQCFPRTMENSKKEEEFKLLRSEGLSFDKISTQLGVSKPTLIKWSRKYSVEISNLNCLALDELREECYRARKDRIQRIASSVSKIEEELGKRDFSDVPTDKLLKCYHEEVSKLNQEFMLEFKQFEELDPSSWTMGDFAHWKVYQD